MTHCRYGRNCHTYQCTFTHPNGRTGDCRYGGGCTRQSTCVFLHPHSSSNSNSRHSRHSRQGNTNTLAVRPTTGSSAIGGSPTARVQIDDGNGRRESLSITLGRQRLCFVAGVDTSGSMAGARIRAAVSGLDRVVDIMEPTDLFGLFTFSDSCRNLHHAMPRRRVRWDDDMRRINANVGGLTAVYDAIAAGIEEMRESQRRNTENLVFEHLVITDGGDNSSTSSLEAITQLVRRPGIRNYNLILIGVDCDSCTDTMRSICAPEHATYVAVNGVAELAGILANQAIRIRMVLSIDNRGNRSRTEATTGLAGVARTAAQLDRVTGSNLATNTLQSLSGSMRGLSIGNNRTPRAITRR